MNMPEMARLYESPETGPLGFLTIAELLQMTGNRLLAQQFAARGLERLGLEDFRRDCASLFPAGSAEERLLVEAIRNLRTLEDGELDALVKTVPMLKGVPLREIRRQIPEKADADIGTVVKTFEANVWEQALKKLVQDELERLRNSSERTWADDGRARRVALAR